MSDPFDSIPVKYPVAFVTGSGSHRVGFEIAKFLGRVGFRIMLHARSSNDVALECRDELKSSGIPVDIVFGQVQQPSNQAAWFSRIRDRFGRLDLLVNCAAVWEPKRLSETNVEDLQLHFDSNVVGTFLSCQQAIEIMRTQPSGGSIVLIGDAAIERPYVDFSAYFASKGAIPTLTRCLAVEAASLNPRIRVNALLPGTILFASDVSETAKQRVRESSLVRREGNTFDLAKAVLFLYQNSFVTGSVISVDGGRNLASETAADAIAHPRWKSQN